MHKFNDKLLQNAIDLNDTIVFEYDINNDVMHYADNIDKYIPSSLHVPVYLEEMEFQGKVCPEDVKKAIAFFSGVGADTRVRMEYLRFMNFEGEYDWYQVKGKTIFDEEGNPYIIYGTYTRIDMDAYGEEEILEKYNRDPLTKLDIKETAVQKITEYLENIPEDVIPNIILVHISDYQNLIQIHGSQVGDTALLEVARILKRALRGSDIIGRYELEKFIICMKGVHDEKVLCERSTYILDMIKQIWKEYKTDSRVSANIGIAVGTEEDEIKFSFLEEKALKALKETKKKRRNTYMIYAQNIQGDEKYKNVGVSGHEIELVKNILDPIQTWAYAVDENYNLIYKNEALSKRIRGECEGLCYVLLKGYGEPCPDCPISRMRERATTVDSIVYSPSLRTAINMRTTRIIMRNGTKVYIMANIKDNLEKQMTHVKECTERFSRAALKIQDLVWEINLDKNTCMRMQEMNILIAQDKRVDNYQTIREYFLDYVVHPEDRGAFFLASDPKCLKEAIRSGRDIVRKEARFLQNSGNYRWYSIITLLEPDDQELNESCIFLTARDIHEMKEEILERVTVDTRYNAMIRQSEFQKEIAQSNERYEHVNELTGILVFEYNVPEQSYYVCSMYDDVFPLEDSMLEDEWTLISSLRPHPDDKGKFEYFLHVIQIEPDTHEVTVRLFNRYEVPVWFTLTVQTLKGLNNKLTRVIGILQNVHTEMEIKAELEFRADYDSVSGLYNSETFYKKVYERIHIVPDRKYAIIAVDINRFRIINDRFGVDMGNRCLEYLGNIIKQSLPWDGIAGRYQGDIFSVLVVYDREQDLLQYMEYLTTNFRFEEAARCGSNLSFGVYKISDIELPVRLMCDRARLAEKDIKGNALTNFAVYDDKIRLLMREQAEIEGEMQQALDNHEFVMFLQPKYSLSTGEICGAEALVRWIHPTKGLRMPGDFLPLFENNGFVKNLDEYMWEVASIYLEKLQKRGIDIPISVNISRLHVHHTGLVPFLISLTEKYHISPHLLELEITENLFMDDVNNLYDTMIKLKKAGFIIQMDDFGSGYSSLNMLRNAPVDVLKIDRFFLDEIMSTQRGRIIVETSIKMAKQLNLQVVAEGVETKEQVEFLKQTGCDIAQGYYYSKPIPISDFEKLVSS